MALAVLLSLVVEHWIRVQKLVIQQFLHSQLYQRRLTLRRFEIPRRERQRGKSLVDVGEHRTCSLHLQLVLHVKRAFVHGRLPLVNHAAVSLAGAHDDIHGIHLSRLNFLAIDALVSCRLVWDHLVAVDHEALHLMRHDTLDNLAAVHFGDFGEHLVHLVRLLSRPDEPHRRVEARLRASDGVRDAPSNRWNGCCAVRSGVADDVRVRLRGDVPVDVAPKVNLRNVASLESNGVVVRGAVVPDDVVQREAARKCDTLLELLALEDCSELCVHHVVDGLAQVDELSAGHEFG
mmetsp:Transcript_6969/g.18043  ORF Transcript_6969/g.18043 Transcript_6969/m.18043 type:complete len:291 (+) Transcript_6969:344-1216(+)